MTALSYPNRKMKVSARIITYITSITKSKLTPSILGFSAFFLTSYANFASAETINEVIETSGGIVKTISELPIDGKLTGSLTITNGTESAPTNFYEATAISIDGGLAETIAFEDFALSLTTYGEPEGSDYHDLYGISEGIISLKNSSITLTANTGKGATYLYAIDNSTIIDFDTTSKISLTNHAPGASQVYGIGGGSVKNFAGSVTITSASEATGVEISDTDVYGTQFASTTNISATAAEYATALSYYAFNSTESVATFNGKFTATSNAGGLATAAAIYSDYYATIGSVSGTYTATAIDAALALDVGNRVKTGAIDATLKITTTGTTYTSDAVGYLGGVGILTGDGIRQSGFDSFSGSITAKGAYNAVGMELHHLPNMQSEGSNVSGMISGNISATTDNTYFLTRDPGGNVYADYSLDDPEFFTDGYATFHFKSTAAIRVVEGYSGGGLDKSILSTKNVPTEASTLQFADGAKAEAWVGAEGEAKRYGDVIQFTVEQLILDAASDAIVTLNGDITTDAQPFGDSGEGGDGGGAVAVAAPEPAPVSIGRVLTYNEGNYRVSSDYWFVSELEMGSSATLGTGNVLLLDSTRFVGTESISFHVNSVADYSNIVVSANEMLTITETNTVNVTLGESIMGTENFEIHLIAGEIMDGVSTELLISLTDLVIGDGTEEGSLLDDLSSIYIKYNGEKVYYAEGMSITMDGTSTNLTIGRGEGSFVPEPSTATLSLLALAGLLARRRRS